MSGSTRELVYRFTTAGKAEVLGVFDSIQERAKKLSGEEAAIVEATEQRKTRARKVGAEGAAKAEQKSSRAGIAAVEQESSARMRAAEKEYHARSRFAEKVALVQAKWSKVSADKEIAERQRIMDAERKFNERTSKDKERAVEKAQRDQVRMERIHASSQRSMARVAERAQRDAMFDRKRAFRSFGTGVSEGIINVGQFGMGLAGSAARHVGYGIVRGTGLDRSYDVGDIVSERLAVDQKLRAIAIETREPGKRSTFNEAAGRRAIEGASSAWGFDQRELVSALDVASEKGKVGQIAGSIGRVGMEARALGVSPEVIAKLRSQILVSADATGQKIGEDDLQKMIAQLSFIGKTGVFRAGAMAQESERLFSSFAASGGNFKTGVARYAAFANEARKATGSGAQAATAIQAVEMLASQKDEKITRLGIATHYKDSGGIERQRDAIDLIEEVIKKTGGRGKAFNSIFAAKSSKGLSTMLTAFNQAGGGDNGVAAMEGLLTKGMGNIKGATPEELAKDAASAMDTEGMKLTASMQTIREKLSDAIAPALSKLADNMPEVVDAITKSGKELDKYIKEHPGIAKGVENAVEWVKENPGKAAAGAAFVSSGIPKTLTRWGIGGATRWLGDRMAGSSVGGRVAKGLLGGVGNIAAEATSTPVYVTGVAPGVGFGGGGSGLPGLPSLGKGAVASAGAIETIETGALGGGAAAAGGVGAVPIAIGVAAMAAIAGVLYLHQKQLDDEVSDARNTALYGTTEDSNPDELEHGQSRETTDDNNPFHLKHGERQESGLSRMIREVNEKSPHEEGFGDWIASIPGKAKAGTLASSLGGGDGLGGMMQGLAEQERAAKSAEKLASKIDKAVDALGAFTRALDKGGHASSTKASPHGR